MNKFNDVFNLVMEKCWKGYQQKGMKKKGDKMVPNCIKEKAKKKQIR